MVPIRCPPERIQLQLTCADGWEQQLHAVQQRAWLPRVWHRTVSYDLQKGWAQCGASYLGLVLLGCSYDYERKDHE